MPKDQRGGTRVSPAEIHARSCCKFIKLMAVKTVFSREDFLVLLAEYNLGDYLASEPFTSGTVQTNYLLRTTAGKFVFRYYENRSHSSVIFETNLIKYLKAKHFPCPAVFSSKHGRATNSFKGKPFAIFEFVEGSHLQHPTAQQKHQLIPKVAELQTLTRGYRPTHTQDRWNYGVDLARTLAQANAANLATPNAAAKLRWFESELQNLQLPRSLPKGICHCDFHFSNVLYKDGEFKALIDFDDANYTYLIVDLASLLNPFIPAFEWDTWQNFAKDANVLDFAESRRIVREYSQHRPLNANEKRHLFDVMKLLILFDCLWWFGRGQVDNFYERR